MRKRLSKYMGPRMLRPILQRTFARLVAVCLLLLLWDRFINTSNFHTARSYVLPIFGVALLVLGWFSFLRMDGVSLPRLRRRKRKKPPVGGMHDVIETEPESGDALSTDEQDFCALAASVVSGALCLICSI